MKSQRLFLSVFLTITLTVYQGVSGQGGYSGGYSSSGSSGYSYPRPDRPLVYPGENEISSQGKEACECVKFPVNFDSQPVN